MAAGGATHAILMPVQDLGVSRLRRGAIDVFSFPRGSAVSCRSLCSPWQQATACIPCLTWLSPALALTAGCLSQDTSEGENSGDSSDQPCRALRAGRGTEQYPEGAWPLASPPPHRLSSAAHDVCTALLAGPEARLQEVLGDGLISLGVHNHDPDSDGESEPTTIRVDELATLTQGVPVCHSLMVAASLLVNLSPQLVKGAVLLPPISLPQGAVTTLEATAAYPSYGCSKRSAGSQLKQLPLAGGLLIHSPCNAFQAFQLLPPGSQGPCLGDGESLPAFLQAGPFSRMGMVPHMPANPL